jgi:hypothetical protein
MKILSTKNYSLFACNPFQRAFRQSKVNALIEKMRANGYPPSMAISVYRAKNGTLTINTGHHRLAAAQALGIPVLYVTEHQWTVKQLVDEGTSGTSWDAVAAAQNFAKQGDKDYQELLGFADKGIPLTMAASLLVGEGAASGNARHKITSGTFKIKTRDHAQKIIALFEEFAARTPAIKHRPFISAFSKCLFTPEFDEDVFWRRMKANPSMLEKTSNEDQALKQIEEIYNFKSANKIPLAYFVKRNSSARKINFGKEQQ